MARIRQCSNGCSLASRTVSRRPGSERARKPLSTLSEFLPPPPNYQPGPGGGNAAPAPGDKTGKGKKKLEGGDQPAEGQPTANAKGEPGQGSGQNGQQKGHNKTGNKGSRGNKAPEKPVCYQYARTGNLNHVDCTCAHRKAHPGEEERIWPKCKAMEQLRMSPKFPHLKVRGWERARRARRQRPGLFAHARIACSSPGPTCVCIARIVSTRILGPKEPSSQEAKRAETVVISLPPQDFRPPERADQGRVAKVNVGRKPPLPHNRRLLRS